MSDIGVIGQIYEDRRTKKRGKLVERDDKYKTLLLESEDGKSFNISFGGFKSNWRSIDEPVETLEEAMQEVEIPEEKIVIKRKRTSKPRDVNPELESVVLEMIEYAKSFGNSRVHVSSVPKRRVVLLKIETRKVFEIILIARKNLYKVCVPEALLLLIREKKYVQENSIQYHNKWINTKYTFTMQCEDVGLLFEDARQYVIDCLCEEE